MDKELTRRGFLRLTGAGLAAIVVGFDPTERRWVTGAHAAGLFEALPPLDGVLLLDTASREAAAEDFGHVVYRMPVAVLQPGSVADIVTMVQFARAHDLQVAARGQGHSTYGQPLVLAGVVIDMNVPAMQAITVADGQARVGAGVRWDILLDETLPAQTPPVLTDYLELTVGGTLAVGGMGGMSSRYGAQIDQVLALTVVTGRGEVVACSPQRERKLFEAVLGGLGQYGIIVEATVRLVRVPSHVRMYMLFYPDMVGMVADQVQLARDQRFDYLEGQVVAAAGGGWQYVIEAAAYFSTPGAPDNAALLNGLHFTSQAPSEDKPYRDFAHRLDSLVATLKAVGAWTWAHPWYDVFVPAEHVAEHVEMTLPTLALIPGPTTVLVYAVARDLFTRPMFQLPESDVVFLFDLLRFIPPVPGAVEQALADNRAFYDAVVELGGTRYPIGAVPNFTQKDWKRHYHGEWGKVVSAKRHFDPDNVLTPGQGIFPTR